MNKTLANITAEDFFKDNKEVTQKLKLAKFPMKMKIAFKHPILGCDGIYIFIDSDMPHLGKKYVNALERSGQTEHKTNLP